MNHTHENLQKGWLLTWNSIFQHITLTLLRLQCAKNFLRGLCTVTVLFFLPCCTNLTSKMATTGIVHVFWYVCTTTMSLFCDDYSNCALHPPQKLHSPCRPLPQLMNGGWVEVESMHNQMQPPPPFLWSHLVAEGRLAREWFDLGTKRARSKIWSMDAYCMRFPHFRGMVLLRQCDLIGQGL